MKLQENMINIKGYIVNIIMRVGVEKSHTEEFG